MKDRDTESIFRKYTNRHVSSAPLKRDPDDLIVHIVKHFTSEGVFDRYERPHFIQEVEKDNLIERFERDSKDPVITREIIISRGLSAKVEGHWITPGLYVEVQNTMSRESEGHFFVNANNYMDWINVGSDAPDHDNIDDAHIRKWIAEIDYKK